MIRKTKKQTTADRKVAALKRKFDEPSNFLALMQSVALPEGYSGEHVTEKWFNGEMHQFAVKSPAAGVTVKFGQRGDGHTSFDVEGRGTLTFDRTGVEDSFYWLPYGSFDLDEKPATPEAMRAIIDEQIARVEQRREYYATAIQLPGLPHTVSAEGLAVLKKEFGRAGACKHFTPAGFGTGYTLSRKPIRDWQGRAPRAKPELEKLLDVAPLYVSTFDAD